MTDAEIQSLLEQIAAQTEAISRLTDSLNRQPRSTSDAPSYDSSFAKSSVDAVYAAQKKQAAMLESFLSKTAATVSRSFAAVEAAGEAAAAAAADSAEAAAKAAGPVHPDKLAKIRQVAADRGRQKGRQEDPAFNKVSLMMTTFGAGLSGLTVGAKKFGNELKAGTLTAGGMVSSFGSVVGAVTSVTKNLGPWGLAISTTAQALAGLAGIAAKQGDIQANVFETLAQSGANTVGGLTDINFMLNKFGLSTDQAAKATALIAANAPALALLGGTVAEGTKTFANVSKVIGESGLRKELKLLGIGYDAQRESMAAFMSIQGRTGSGQKKTFEQLAVSAAAYMKEQDAVTRATGVTAKEQQASQARALNEEMFRTRQNKLRLRGEDDLANKELEVYSTIEAFSGKDVAIQFGAMMDGVLNDANKGLQMLTGGRAYTIAQDQSLSGAEKAEQLNAAIKEGLASQGQTVGSVGNFQKEYNISLGQVSDKVLGTIKTPEERLAAGKGQQDDLINKPSKGVKSSVEAAENVLKAMRNWENAVQIGVDGAQTFGEKVSGVAKRISDLFPEKTAKGDSTGEKILDGMSSAFDTATAPFLGGFKLLTNLLSGGGFAEGGVAEGPKSGYLALLHGKEQITPWDQIVKRQDDKSQSDKSQSGKSQFNKAFGSELSSMMSKIVGSFDSTGDTSDMSSQINMMLNESMSELANITGAKSAGKGEVGSGPAFSKVSEMSALMEKVITGIDKSNMYLKDILDEITGGATVGGAKAGGSTSANTQAALAAHDHNHPHGEEGAAVSPEVAKQISAGFVNPLEKMVQTSGMMRNDGKTYHGGIDLGGKIGDKIMAPITGKITRVLEAGKGDGGFGNAVEVEDAVTGMKHMFAHMDKSMAKVGDTVTAGTQIGTLGNTGQSTGPHLHHEIKDKMGNRIDPSQFYTGVTDTQGRPIANTGFGSTAGGAATGNPQAARRGQGYGAPQVPNAPMSGDVQNNLGLMTEALKKQGITDPKMINATLASVMKETGGKNVEEDLAGYANTSNSRIREVFGARAAKKSDKELDEIKKDPKQFAEMMYGKDSGMGLGNKDPGDAYKYRGRGMIGITGRANYEQSSKELFGDDRLAKNPEMLNDPAIAAQTSAWFMKKHSGAMAEKLGMKGGPQDQSQANLLAASTISGTAIKPGQGYLGKENLDKVNAYSAQLSGGQVPVAAAPVAGAAPTAVAGAAPPTAVAGFNPGAQQQRAQQPVTIAGMAQNILGSIFGGFGGGAPAATPAGMTAPEGMAAPSGIAGPTLPGPSTDMSAITQALQAQTTATQSAITSSMENMTTRLVESLGTASGGGGVASAEVPALLGDIVSAQREQTAAINRLISVQTA